MGNETSVYGHRENVGLRKLGNPEGFRFFSWECLDDEIALLQGCVPTRKYMRGKRAGRWDYSSGTKRKVYVTEAEVKAEYARYEAETGKCGECFGTGETWAGYSPERGSYNRPCWKCQSVTRALEAVE